MKGSRPTLPHFWMRTGLSFGSEIIWPRSLTRAFRPSGSDLAKLMFLKQISSKRTHFPALNRYFPGQNHAHMMLPILETHRSHPPPPLAATWPWPQISLSSLLQTPSHWTHCPRSRPNFNKNSLLWHRCVICQTYPGR